MSSSRFEVRLRVDPEARRIVRYSGFGLAIIGVPLIFLLPVHSALRLLLLILWLGDCGLALWRLELGFRKTTLFRFAATGEITVDGPGHSKTAVGLCTGSVVYRRLAWLRITWPDGSRHAELLLASRAEGLQWHRFQLIWRLCREHFGHPRSN